MKKIMKGQLSLFDTIEERKPKVPVEPKAPVIEKYKETVSSFDKIPKMLLNSAVKFIGESDGNFANGKIYQGRYKIGRYFPTDKTIYINFTATMVTGTTKYGTLTGYGLIKQYTSVKQLLDDWELDSLKLFAEENKEILEELGI